MEQLNSPKHIAIIMDGNGRWAKARGHMRMWGHVRGARVVSKIITQAVDLNVQALTLYTFSTENWARPQDEIKTLFKLLKKFLQLERRKIMQQNVLFRVMGDYVDFPADVLATINEVVEESKNNTGMKMTLALGYGSRHELVYAVNKLIAQGKNSVTEDDITNSLYLADLPDVDLMIRTGGDQRLSNFLLWQMAYAELFFTNTPWPDFSAIEFKHIVEQFAQRERRFGHVQEVYSLDEAKTKAQQNRQLLKGVKHV